MSVYLVKRGAYRGYRAGERFEANLPEAVEARAVERGTIEVMEVSRPALPDGYRLQPAADAANEEGADAHESADPGRRPNGA